MANFDLVNLALKTVCPSNEVILDDKGLPSVMVYVPKFKMSDVIDGASDSTAPMFIINGQEKPGLYLSKFGNVIHNGRAYSLPGEDPTTNITFDTARQACEAKGRGWHLMTRAEYAAIALWCKKNGFMPWGNNDYGKDSRESVRIAIPAPDGIDGQGRTTRTLTGTGPIEWSHNKNVDGIWDLNGNVSEWTGGIRTVYGEIQLLVNNDAADSNNSQSADATTWKAIDATTGDFVDPNGSGTTPGTVKVDCVASKPQYRTVVETESESFSAVISEVTCDASIEDPAKDVLISYGLLPDDGSFDYGEAKLSFNNKKAEIIHTIGGEWNSGANSGVFSIRANFTRTLTNVAQGFRSAYVEI